MKKMLSLLKRGGVAVASAPILLMSNAHAVLPVAATTAFTEVETNASDLISLGWGTAAVVVGGMVAIGLFKKVVSKAT